LANHQRTAAARLGALPAPDPRMEVAKASRRPEKA